MGRIVAGCLLSIIVLATGPNWSLVESGSIGVITDDSPDLAAEMLNSLVAMQSMLQQIAAVEPPPLRVFALRDQQSFKQLAPKRLRRDDIHTFGFSHTGPHSAFVALRTDRPAGLITETLRHEYAHVLTAALSPEAPAWLDEGLSEFWSSIVTDGDRVVAGRPSAKHLELLRKQKWLPLSVMLKQPRGSLPSRPGDVSLFYAQAWAMVHYLLLGQDANELTSLMPSIDPLPPQFESAVRRYIDGGRLREIGVRWQRPTEAGASTLTLSEARAMAERADLLMSGEEPRSALPVVRQALAIDPKEPLALEVTGAYYFLSNQPGPARQWLTQALDTGVNSYRAAIYMSLLVTSPADQERYLTMAIQAKPDSDVAWQRLTALFERDGRLAKARRWCEIWRKLCVV